MSTAQSQMNQPQNQSQNQPQMQQNLPGMPVKQRPFVGVIAWLVQRVTAILLLILLPLKLYSGYAIVGKLPGGGVISALHINPLLDALLVFALIFHALYGIRVMCIDFGWVKDNRQVFTIFTIIGAVLSAIGFFVIVS